MANTCIFCGTELTLFNRTKLHAFGTEQPACKACCSELIDLSASDRARRALATGQATEADRLRDELAKQEARDEARQEESRSDKTCLRCGAPMIKMGQHQLQMGEHTFLFGDWSHLLAGSLTVDILCCEQCRKVEFFLPEEEK